MSKFEWKSGGIGDGTGGNLEDSKRVSVSKRLEIIVL